MLDNFVSDININVGLYRDDGLATCKQPPRQTEKTKTEICKIFKDNGLKITIQANLKTVDFLDKTMDLQTGEHKPYMKPNNTPLYVHKQSNHPPNIIKNIPENINQRLSAISSNKNIFNQATKPYQDALKKSGYSHKLEYNPAHKNTNTHTTDNKRKRKRHITWYNPPYSHNTTTNIGKKFLDIIDTCFPPTHKLHRLLNRNTVTLSYSCMPNMKQIIASHNKTLINTKNTKLGIFLVEYPKLIFSIVFPKECSIPSNKDHQRALIGSAYKHITAVRWRTFFFQNPNIPRNSKETYGFGSTKTAPVIPELKQYEDGLLNIIRNTKYRQANDKFQNQLEKDKKDIKNTDRLIIQADKTTNFYKMEQNTYNQLLDVNVTKGYKKAPTTIEEDITFQDKTIATKLELDDRIDVTAQKQAFITLKDHKPNFRNNPTCRLINPQSQK